MKKAHGPQQFLKRYGELKRTLTTLSLELFRDAEIGRTQARIIKQVSQKGRMSQAEVARATDTDPALTGRAMQGLIEQGILKRERSAHDRRAYLVELGPKGRKAVAEVDRTRLMLAERAARPLNARDFEDFDRIVKKIVEAPQSASPNKKK